ncbi:hypothetical protein ACFX2A_026097 [Malus domestica]
MATADGPDNRTSFSARSCYPDVGWLDKDADSVLKLRLSFGSKTDNKLVITPFPVKDDEPSSCAQTPKLMVDTSSLSICMKGKHREIRDRVVEYFNKRLEFQTPMEILKDNYQELYMKQLVGLGREAEIRLFRFAFWVVRFRDRQRDKPCSMEMS